MAPENQPENIETNPPKPPAEKLDTPEIPKTDLEKAKDHFNHVKQELEKLIKNPDKSMGKRQFKKACSVFAKEFTSEEINLLLTESTSQKDKLNDYRKLNHITKIDENVGSEPGTPLIRYYFRLAENPAPPHFEGVVKKGEKIQMNINQ